MRWGGGAFRRDGPDLRACKWLPRVEAGRWSRRRRRAGNDATNKSSASSSEHRGFVLCVSTSTSRAEKRRAKVRSERSYRHRDNRDNGARWRLPLIGQGSRYYLALNAASARGLGRDGGLCPGWLDGPGDEMPHVMALSTPMLGSCAWARVVLRDVDCWGCPLQRCMV